MSYYLTTQKELITTVKKFIVSTPDPHIIIELDARGKHETIIKVLRFRKRTILSCVYTVDGVTSRKRTCFAIINGNKSICCGIGRIGRIFEFVKTIGAMLRSFSQPALTTMGYP